MSARKTNRNPNQLWTWPIFLGATSAVGLISALLGDGWADVLSWFGLGLPVVVACVFVLRAKGSVGT
jgi:hypothetical protein